MQQYLLPDWFSHNIPNFLEIKARLDQHQRVLVIGSFEGRSTSWILQNFLSPNGHIVCLDTFAGSPEHTQIELSGLFERWRNNVESVRGESQTCVAHIGKSYHGLARLIAENESFDFIYVDGSHTAPDVLTDACMTWGLLRVGGIVLFDDYQWPDSLGPLQCPKPAVNAFTQIFADHGEVIISNYQLAIRKLS
jgi:predicted O-methyltransferase YrrM